MGRHGRPAALDGPRRQWAGDHRSVQRRAGRFVNDHPVTIGPALEPLRKVGRGAPKPRQGWHSICATVKVVNVADCTDGLHCDSADAVVKFDPSLGRSTRTPYCLLTSRPLVPIS